MCGYWNNSEETKHAFRDSFFRTETSATGMQTDIFISWIV